MRERARLDAEELVPRPPFDIFGLAEPPLRPAVLAETGRVNGEWETITLAYGDWPGLAGPLITVTSAVVRPGAFSTAAEADLVRVIDRERNRVADHAGVNEEEPPGPLGEDVPSQPAQQAWARYWAHRTAHTAHGLGRARQAVHIELIAGQPLNSAWLQAWTAWTRDR